MAHVESQFSRETLKNSAGGMSSKGVKQTIVGLIDQATTAERYACSRP
jgi:hypothetical protein